jgi:hypothetical protein
VLQDVDDGVPQRRVVQGREVDDERDEHEQRPASDGPGQERDAPALEHGQEVTPTRPGRRGPQRQRERGAEREERGREEGEQKMLRHVHGERDVRVRVDGRGERDREDPQARGERDEAGAGPPTAAPREPPHAGRIQDGRPGERHDRRGVELPIGPRRGGIQRRREGRRGELDHAAILPRGAAVRSAAGRKIGLGINRRAAGCSRRKR